MSGAMPEMDLLVKVGMVMFIGVLIGVIVVYHVWMDRRRARLALSSRVEVASAETATSRVP